MSIHSKLVLYLCSCHLLFILPLAYFYERQLSLFFLLEAAFIVSLLIGLRFAGNVRALFSFLHSSGDALREADYGNQYRRLGQPELDQLIEIYNKMLAHLREERLRLGEQRSFLEKLLAATPAAIVTFDFDERIATLNPSAEALFDEPVEAVTGRRLADISHPLASTLAGMNPGESQLVTHAGSRRLKCTKSQFRDRGFRRSFFIIEELTRELQQTEKGTYEKLIRMMSHEINNSLGAAASLLDSCVPFGEQLDHDDRLEFEGAMSVIKNRMNHLNGFMSGFAEFVRLPKPQMVAGDLLPMLRELAMLFRPQCDDRDIDWVWELSSETMWITHDRHQMEQVMVNLIKNALEAIGHGGWIAIRLQDEPGRRVLTVADSGGGLIPKVRDQLFTPFFTTKTGGQGIGLLLIREILSQHQVPFTLEGEPGGETRFAMIFPARVRGG